MKYVFLTLLLLLSGCTLSGGVAYHNAGLDSEFKEKDYIGFVQADAKVTDNVYIYGRHESMLFVSDRDTVNGGSGGINSIGSYVKFKLFD